MLAAAVDNRPGLIKGQTPLFAGPQALCASWASKNQSALSSEREKDQRRCFNDNLTPGDGSKMFRRPADFMVFERGWTLRSHLRQEHRIDDVNNAIVGWYVRLHNMSHIDLNALPPIDVNLLSLDCCSR
jgi:hypothetical protein